MRYPKDCEERRIGSKAKICAMSAFNVEHWEVREQTGQDYGVDLIAELSENDEWHNRKLECQIKGTTSIKLLGNGMITYPLDVKTINYALSSSVPFILILVDVNKLISYYLPIQKFFIDNLDFENKLNNITSISVHINPKNIISYDDYQLRELTHHVYKLKIGSNIPEEI